MSGALLSPRDFAVLQRYGQGDRMCVALSPEDPIASWVLVEGAELARGPDGTVFIYREALQKLADTAKTVPIWDAVKRVRHYPRPAQARGLRKSDRDLMPDCPRENWHLGVCMHGEPTSGPGREEVEAIRAYLHMALRHIGDLRARACFIPHTQAFDLVRFTFATRKPGTYQIPWSRLPPDATLVEALIRKELARYDPQVKP